MNTNKKVVRLTESQLHNIIAESVSQILMELDPRTYASAAKKSEERGERLDTGKHPRRSQKFLNAAYDTWNDKYAQDNIKMTGEVSGYDNSKYGINEFGPEYASGFQINDFEDTKDGRFGTRYGYTFDSIDPNKNKWGIHADASPYSNVELGHSEQYPEPVYDGEFWYDGRFYPSKHDDDYSKYAEKVENENGWDLEWSDPRHKDIEQKITNRLKSKISPKGWDVARQMSLGDGKYVKGKGWE